MFIWWGGGGGVKGSMDCEVYLVISWKMSRVEDILFYFYFSFDSCNIFHFLPFLFIR